MAFELVATVEIVDEPAEINGMPVDAWQEPTHVRIAGPFDSRVCKRCAPFVGRVFKNNDPRIRCWTHGSGMHPRCRHWAEPVPPKGAEDAPPSDEAGPSGFLADLIESGDVKQLEQIMGPVRARLLASKTVSLEQLYTEKGVMKTLGEMGYATTGTPLRVSRLDDLRTEGFSLSPFRKPTRRERSAFLPGSRGPRAEMSRAERIKNAKLSHKPMTKVKEAIATASEDRVKNAIGGLRTPDNEPFDVIKDKDAIEVKTIIEGVNPKITMHKASLARKKAYARKHGKRQHTVAIDHRTNKVYYRAGTGSFRLSSMQELENINALTDQLTTPGLWKRRMQKLRRKK